MRAAVVVSAALLAALGVFGCAEQRSVGWNEQTSSRVCKRGEPCWPSAAEWQQFGTRLAGKVEQVQSPLQPCRSDPASAACAAAMRDLKNPFAIEDRAGGTQSLGWLGAWEAAPSAYAVAVENAQDVAAAIDFARGHHLRLVVKGTGHDYLGRSSATDSLLVWTHRMRQVTLHDAFVGQGCPQTQVGIAAVSVGAGTRWIEAYQEVTVKHHRYVQGGGCTSVGAAGGFLQGGGFGSWSKKYGIAAAGMLEAEVVTADGRVLVANACQNQDLFWALRGGGGGTFGVVTKATLMTHPLPENLGFVMGSIEAKSDAAYRDLLERFVGFYAAKLHNENWGEQVQVRGDNSLRLSMSFAGLSAAEAQATWRPFLAWFEQRPQDYRITANYLALPADKMRDPGFIAQQVPAAIVRDQRAEQDADHFWWAGDGEQVATYWYAYQSRWLPSALFQPAQSKALASALFAASRHWSLELHFNKGQAGAAADAIRRGRETAMNPAVYNAAALITVAASGQGYPGVRGSEPNVAQAEARKARVTAAMQIIRGFTPGAGAYVNETDYFEPDWQQTFWGENYPRLLQIKRKYDPRGMFTCHHCVGS